MSTEVTTTPVAVQTTATVTPQPGGLIGAAQADLTANPSALLLGAAAVLAYIGILFAVVLIAALFGNKTASHYVDVIFSASAVWAVLGAVLIGGAYVLPSPVAR